MMGRFHNQFSIHVHDLKQKQEMYIAITFSINIQAFVHHINLYTQKNLHDKVKFSVC